MKNIIIVFLGPTLSRNEAKKILPQALYLSPVRSGDVLRAVRLKPRVIAIIDGLFERMPSVWHKEILFAMEKGIRVFGSSSMGALRARELSDFGMTGVGDIFNAYRESLNEDDAVAVLHGSHVSGFLSETVAFVNIKATLSQIVLENNLDPVTAQLIEAAAKELFYPFRSLEHIVEKAKNLGADANKLLLFEKWIEKNGWIDVKKQDAIQLLSMLAADDCDNSSSARISILSVDPVNVPSNSLLSVGHPEDLATPSYACILSSADYINVFLLSKTLSLPSLQSIAKKKTFYRSLFFRTHMKYVMCRPFLTYHEDLPLTEKVAAMSRYLGTTYRQTRRLAYLLSTCYALAKTFLTELPSDFIFDFSALPPNFYAEEKAHETLARYLEIQKLLYLNQQEPVTKETSEEYLFALMRLSLTGEYNIYKKDLYLFREKEPIKYQLFSLTASLWWLVEQYAVKNKLTPNQQAVHDFSDKFRVKQKLYSPAVFQEWLSANEMTVQEYAELMRVGTRLNYLVLQNNMDALGIIDTEEGVWWFLDALYLSGVYAEAKLLLDNPETARIQYSKQAGYYSSTDIMAHDLDFMSEAEMGL